MASRTPRSPQRSPSPRRNDRQPSLTPRKPLNLSGRGASGPAFGARDGIGGFLRDLSDTFYSWSPRRRVRFLRTLAIGLVLVLVLWRCTSGGDDSTSTTTVPSTTRVAPTTTTPLPAATTATATRLAQKLPSPHVLAGGTAFGKRILLAGGLDKTKTSTTVVWSFDPATGATSKIGDLPLPVHTPAMAPLGSGVLVMGGGKGTTVYDKVLSVSRTGAVTETGKLPQPRTNATAVRVPGDKGVVLLGGYSGKSPTNEVLRTTDGVTFTPVAVLSHPVRFPAVAVLGRSIWVIGGEFDQALTPGIQRVDLDSGLVTDVAPLPVGLSRGSGFTLGGAIFVAGGRTAKGPSDQIYRIDPITGATTVAGTLPEPRSDATAVVSGTTAYLFGGLAPTATDTIVAVTAA
ncbi:MAG: hypothetical protein U0Q22_10000 [Acidimicrobiales bacterium]